MTEADEEEDSSLGNIYFGKPLKIVKRESNRYKPGAGNVFETDYVAHSYQKHETNYQVVIDGPRNKIEKVDQSFEEELFPCRFCEQMLAPGKIFEHESKCDLKPKKLILFERAPISKPKEL